MTKLRQHGVAATLATVMLCYGVNGSALPRPAQARGYVLHVDSTTGGRKAATEFLHDTSRTKLELTRTEKEKLENLKEEELKDGFKLDPNDAKSATIRVVGNPDSGTFTVVVEKARPDQSAPHGEADFLFDRVRGGRLETLEPRGLSLDGIRSLLGEPEVNAPKGHAKIVLDGPTEETNAAKFANLRELLAEQFPEYLALLRSLDGLPPEGRTQDDHVTQFLLFYINMQAELRLEAEANADKPPPPVRDGQLFSGEVYEIFKLFKDKLGKLTGDDAKRFADAVEEARTEGESTTPKEKVRKVMEKLFNSKDKEAARNNWNKEHIGG